VRSLRARARDNDGSAIIEFIVMALVLMVPLVYVILSAFEVQRSAFGVAEAARQAGRAYATSGPDDDPQARAFYAANLAVADQGLGSLPAGGVSISTPGGFCAGATVTVTVSLVAHPPMLRGVVNIPVSAEHTETLDEFQDLAC
jgi:Flp pilus assembly protein TadG